MEPTETAQPAPVRSSALVRREVLMRTLTALESSVEDGINYGLSRVEPEYLAAIAEAKAEQIGRAHV
mgnify:CR=1 FL=1